MKMLVTTIRDPVTPVTSVWVACVAALILA
jgi:hypothetical protein